MICGLQAVVVAGWRTRLLARSGMAPVRGATSHNLENETAPTPDWEEAHDMKIDEGGGDAGGVGGVLDGLGLEGVGVEVPPMPVKFESRNRSRNPTPENRIPKPEIRNPTPET